MLTIVNEGKERQQLFESFVFNQNLTVSLALQS